jgi:hypothetical protein
VIYLHVYVTYRQMYVRHAQIRLISEYVCKYKCMRLNLSPEGPSLKL